MSEPRGLSTAVAAVLVAGMGFGVGAMGGAWWARAERADPWRSLRVEHEGLEGRTMRTRIVYEDPKLALQDVEVTVDSEGEPQLARVALREGEQLTVRFDERLPASIEAADGAGAKLAYSGNRVTVSFVDAAGKELAERVVRAPIELRTSLRMAAVESSTNGSARAAFGELAALLVGEARADDDAAEAAEEETLSVQREIELRLELRASGKVEPGVARIEASCAPLTCIAATPEATMPGASTVRVTVAATTPKRGIAAPKGEAALDPFRRAAREERGAAASVLPHVKAVVAALGVTALACARADRESPICVDALATGEKAGGVVDALSSHEIATEGRVVDARAEALYYEAQAREKLGKRVAIEICASRQGFSRGCTTVEGNPFADEPMARASRSIELRRGIEGTLVGGFEMTQSDGADCRFSPSPRTSGTLRLTFDNRSGRVTGSLQANETGTRPNLRCSMGTANMRWNQAYSATLTQTFTPEQLLSGGKLPLRLTGTMGGTGSFSFSNCRSSGGVAANCPGGRRESYSYPVELVGDLDLGSQTGSGRLVVNGAPLATSGSWRVPAEAKP